MHAPVISLLPLTDAKSAVALVRDGHRVFVGSGAAVPSTLLDALSAHGESLRDVELCHLLTLGDAPYVAPALEGRLRHNAFFVGKNTRDAVDAGRADFTPIFLSEIAALMRGPRPIDVALVQIGPPDEHGYCSLGVSVDIVKPAVDSARIVIAEVNARMPRTHGDAFVHISRLTCCIEVDRPLLERAVDPIDAVARAIGDRVAALVDDGDTLQLGIGTIPNAVLAALHDHRNLGIHTEMFSDGVVDLVEAGVVTNASKTIHRGKIISSFVLGTRRVYDFVDDNPEVEMRPSHYVNDPFVIARNRGMAAINSALAVDLTGQVCADALGPHVYSGIGGQVDFLRGAARSDGGKPIIALPSLARDGTVSRIVAELPPGAGVTTSRGDVHWVVTEHGVVNLHGLTLRARARALIDLAAPSARDELTVAARQRRWI